MNYHVVEQRLSPQQLENGSFDTRAGSTLTTDGSGSTFSVNGSSNVVCGNLQTLNATLYLVDTALMRSE